MLDSKQPSWLILLKLALPLILTGVVQSSTFYFETLFLAKLGTNVLAAGTLVSWLSGTFWVILFGALAAINILVANFHGEGNAHKVALVLRDGVRLCMVIIPLSMIGFWFVADLFPYFGLSYEVVDLSRLYLQALVWGMFPSFMYNALIEFVVGIGEASIVLKFSMINALSVIAFSYLLIFGGLGISPMGITGAGLGWSCGVWVSFLFLFLYIKGHKKFDVYCSELLSWQPSLYVKELIKIGMPIGLMYSVEIAFFMVLNIFMGVIGGNILLAANQIVLQYLAIFMSIIFSIAQAITVRMGHLLGERKLIACKTVAFEGSIMSLFTGLCAAVCFVISPQFLIGLDFDVHISGNLPIVELATRFFSIAAFFVILESIRVSFFGILRALKDTHVTLLISVISFWLLALPLGYLLASVCRLGGIGFWYAMIIGVLASIGLLYWRYKVLLHNYFS